MEWLILFFVLLIGISAIYFISVSKKKNREGVVFFDRNARYINGFKEISGGTNAFVDLTKDELKIELPLKDIKKSIKIENIIDAECHTEDTISREVSAGRLILFGALALGMAKSKNIIRKYAVIKFKENDNDNNLILEMNPDRLVQTILNLKQG